MQRIITILCVLIVLVSCGTPESTWVQELAQRNPFANDTNYISVYFRFDTHMETSNPINKQNWHWCISLYKN